MLRKLSLTLLGMSLACSTAWAAPGVSVDSEGTRWDQVAQVNFSPPRFSRPNFSAPSGRPIRFTPVRSAPATSAVPRFSTVNFTATRFAAPRAPFATFRTPVFARPAMTGSTRAASSQRVAPARPSSPVALESRRAQGVFRSGLSRMGR